MKLDQLLEPLQAFGGQLELCPRFRFARLQFGEAAVLPCSWRQLEDGGAGVHRHSDERPLRCGDLAVERCRERRFRARDGTYASGAANELMDLTPPGPCGAKRRLPLLLLEEGNDLGLRRSSNRLSCRLELGLFALIGYVVIVILILTVIVIVVADKRSRCVDLDQSARLVVCADVHASRWDVLRESVCFDAEAQLERALRRGSHGDVEDAVAKQRFLTKGGLGPVRANEDRRDGSLGDGREVAQEGHVRV